MLVVEQRVQAEQLCVVGQKRNLSSLVGPQCHNVIHDTFLVRQCSHISTASYYSLVQNVECK